MCNSKKSKFIKQQEVSELLNIDFCFNCIKQVNTRYKMNEIVNKFLIDGDKFMPEMHLREPGITYIVLVDDLPKIKKECKYLKKQDIHDVFIKMDKIKLVFNMKWLMEILRI